MTLVFAGIGLAATVFASAPQSFEVASIKPSAGDGRRVGISIAPGGRFTASGINVKWLVQEAYDVRDFQISGGPDWLTSQRYDIVAKADEPNLTREKIRPMLRSLLAERFNLKIHRETKELPTYALVVAKNGPKLRASDVKNDAQPDEPAPKAVGPGTPTGPAHAEGQPAPVGARRKGASIRMGRGRLDGQDISVSEIANLLAQQVGRPVEDQTGLRGKYDFILEWTPDENMRGGGPFGDGMAHEGAPGGDSSGPSIFTALQEQLGLKLESKKGPVEILVIDHVDRASEN